MNQIKLLYIDLFCGAGGTSTGVEYAQLHGEKCAKVIACVNHDPNAILSHAANHPDTLHFILTRHQSCTPSGQTILFGKNVLKKCSLVRQ